MRFPTVTGSNLEGVDFTVPTDLAGRANLVLLAFFDHQQPVVDEWLVDAASLAAAHPGFRVYEIPLIQQTIPAMHRFIDRGMAAGISDRRARARTIPVYTDKTAFLRSLSITTDDVVHALLLDQEGDVVWRARGGPDEAARVGLARSVEETLTGTVQV